MLESYVQADNIPHEHSHPNMELLNKFGTVDGQLAYEGKVVSGSGSVGTGNVDLSNYYNKEEVNALIPDSSKYALKTDIPTVPANVSAFTNDAGYLTEHQSLDSYATKTYVDDAIAAQTHLTEIQVNALIDAKVGVIENGTY